MSDKQPTEDWMQEVDETLKRFRQAMLKLADIDEGLLSALKSLGQRLTTLENKEATPCPDKSPE